MSLYVWDLIIWIELIGVGLQVKVGIPNLVGVIRIKGVYKCVIILKK